MFEYPHLISECGEFEQEKHAMPLPVLPIELEGMRILTKLPLPAHTEVFRASGRCICEACGKPYYEHPEYTYPGLDYGPDKGCDGKFYHL